jgi:hypothetical protein
MFAEYVLRYFCVELIHGYIVGTLHELNNTVSLGRYSFNLYQFEVLLWYEEMIALLFVTY